nr:M20/M25/M40 family metallo-hydrolase [Roseibium sp.]
MLNDILDLVDRTIDARLTRLNSFLRIQSISTDSTYSTHCARAVNWVATQLRDLGAVASVHSTKSHPIVLGKLPAQGKRLLFYGHYDVQPVDPLELWESEPFQPTYIDNGDGAAVVARGSADDKGQMSTFLEALRAWKEVIGDLPSPLRS